MENYIQVAVLHWKQRHDVWHMYTIWKDGQFPQWVYKFSSWDNQKAWTFVCLWNCSDGRILHLILKNVHGRAYPNPHSSFRTRCGPHRTTSIILGKICAQMFPFAKTTLFLPSLYNAILFARKSKYINIKIYIHVSVSVRSKFILIWYLQKQIFFHSLTFNEFWTWNQTTRI